MYGHKKITSPRFGAGAWKASRLLVVALLACLVLGGCRDKTELSAQDHLRKAQRLIQAGDFEAAYMQLAEALHKSPEDPEVHLNLGWLYLYTDETAKAQEELKQLTRMRPKDAGTYHLRGALYDHLEQYPDAIRNYRQAEALKSDNPRLYFDMAEAQASLNQNEASVATLKKGFDLLDKGDKESQLNFLFAICAAQSRMQQFDQAIETCSDAARISPSEAEREHIDDFINNMKLIRQIEDPTSTANP